MGQIYKDRRNDDLVSVFVWQLTMAYAVISCQFKKRVIITDHDCKSDSICNHMREKKKKTLGSTVRDFQGGLTNKGRCSFKISSLFFEVAHL